ncbi:hypothetical protein ACES2L_06100 [Bdellovibrio bacteriovorus]
MSKMIRWFQGGSQMSHALCILNGMVVFQAVNDGVETMPLDLFLKENVITEQVHYTLTDVQRLRLEGYVAGCIGKEYSQSQLLGIVISKWLGIEWKIFKNGTRKFICSELCANILTYVLGIYFGPADLITPIELRDHLLPGSQPAYV